MEPVTATRDDRRTVTADLLAAFDDDPVLHWVFRHHAGVRAYGRHFFSLAARRMLPQGHSWRVEGGAALWAGPGHWHAPAREDLELARRCWRGVGLRAPWVLRGLLGVQNRHPEVPHMYLAAIGVRAERRGGGVGAGLLAPGLAHADARGLPCYLESSNPRNVSFYVRHGFRATEEVRLPGRGGPVVTLMWRDAVA